MIQNKTDLKYYLEQDKIALKICDSSIKDRVRLIVYPNHIYIYQKTLRKYEYLLNSTNINFRFLKLFLVRRKFNKLSEKLNFMVSPNCCKEGLRLVHPGGIIINPNARIGKYCTIRPFTVIGNKRTNADDLVPQIGDNVEIGCNVSIIGKIVIGNNVKIGGGSVVVKDVPSNCVCVGNPSKIILN